ncbi:MAG: hypothetical protein KAI39_09980 [Desulfobulbaceae bacterium]|nr:hypothetical protein [Desulfobulbaceae bacterium]
MAESETIQEDVEQNETVEEIQEVQSGRETVMDDIIKKQREQREQPEETETLTETEEPESTEQENTTEEPGDDLVKIVVDGVEKEVPRSKVLEHGIRTMQKESTADARLRLAATRRAELNDMERRLQLKQQQKQVKPESSVDTEAFGKEFNDALYDDDGKAGGMIAKVLEDQQQLRNMVDQSNKRVTVAEQRAASAEQILQKQVVKERQALSSTFADKFESIDKDPALRNMANNRTVELMSLHPDWSDKEIIVQAGEDVQTWLDGVAGVPTSIDSQKEKKRNMTKQPRSVGARSPGKPEVKRKTRADVFREIKSGRGQPVD